MATSVNAEIGREKYQVSITAGSKSIIADEPVEKGGLDKGFSPTELLLSSLGACTSVTVRMYADRKQISLDGIKVHLELQRDEEKNITSITRNIALSGNLTEEDRHKLLNVANKCPVHKILTSNIQIETRLV